MRLVSGVAPGLFGSGRTLLFGLLNSRLASADTFGFDAVRVAISASALEKYTAVVERNNETANRQADPLERIAKALEER